MKKVLLTLTLIATFILILTGCSVSQYSVEFDYNGAGEKVIQTIPVDTKVTKPADPAKAGYVFVGWYLEDELYDFDAIVTKNIKLVANFADAENTVTFVVDDETAAEVNVNYGEAVVAIENPAKDGYTFAGWYLEDVLYDIATPVVKDITLVAKWRYELKLKDVIGSWNGLEEMMGMEMAKLALTVKADGTAVAKYEMSGYQTPLTIDNIKIENGTLVVEYDNGNKGTITFEYVDGDLVANTGITVADYGTTKLEKVDINAEEVAGTWEGEESYSGMGIPYTVVVNADGTVEGSFDMFGSVTNLECKEVSNKIVFDYYGIEIVFVYDGTSFYGIGAMGQAVVLNKKQAVEEITLAQVAGTWTGSEEFYGMQFDYEFVINADGTGTAKYESPGYPTTMTVEEYKIVDGKLVLEYNVDGYPYDPLTFELKDGKLVGTSPMGTIVTLNKTVSVADFAGTWTGVEETAYGNYNYTIILNADGTGTGTYVDEAGLYPSDMVITALTITDDKVVLTYESYSMEYTIEFTYQDGLLVSELGAMWGSLTLER